AILDFVFEEDKDKPDKCRYDVQLTDIETCKVFYDKLTFIYLEMPKFTKTVEQLETRFEKWLYVLRNLPRIQEIPEVLQEQIFTKLFETAEIAQFNREELRSYENSLKYYRDLKNSMDTARDEGREEGIRKTALAFLNEGVSEEIVLRVTGLTAEQLEQLKREM
ncbi:MAG: Rpn family recombination-promoting nuclease/putative transposase, partial [Spirulinaceae cyanobacterium]